MSMHTNTEQHTLFYLPICSENKNGICMTLAFVDEPHQMLKMIQYFTKHCHCHLQGKYVIAVHF